MENTTTYTGNLGPLDMQMKAGELGVVCTYHACRLI